MSGDLLEKLTSAGPIFLLWHFLTLILCVTGLLLERILRKGNPHVRSSLLRLTLLLALVVPVVCSIWNRSPAASFMPAQSIQEKSELVSTRQTLPNFAVIDWDLVAVWRPMIADLGQLQGHLVTSTTFGPHSIQIFYGVILGTSPLISLYLLTQLVLAVLSSLALRRRGKPLEVAEEARCRIMASAMGIPAPQVLQINGLESPLLLGFFKSVILLPDGIQARDEIYGHELTHLRRHDMWWHLFARLATVLMPLQPGFWLLKKALERADEDVCDDMVLMQGANRSAYAELLLNVAESQRSPNPDLCLPMAAFRSQLEHRLHRLMDTTRPLSSRLSLSSLGLCLAPLFTVGILTGAVYQDVEHPLTIHAQTPNQGPKPLDDSTAPIIRSIEPEVFYVPSIPLQKMKAEIIAESGLQIGMPCLAIKLKRALQRIFATGNAANVAITSTPVNEGVKISIAVQVNPIVKQVSFQGVSAEQEAKLRPLLHLKEGAMSSDYLVFNDAKVLTSELGKEGLHLVATGTSTLNIGDNISPLTSSVTFKITPL